MSTVKQMYHQDFYAWVHKNAELIRQGRFSEIDADHIAEELEDVGKSERRELFSRLTQLLMHLLKWQFQPDQRPFYGRSWMTSISKQRIGIKLVLRDSPGLQPQLENYLAEAYSDARRFAAKETGLPLTSLPETCPYTLAQALDPDFLPD